MEVKKQCPQCNHTNIFKQEDLAKKAAVYKPVKPSLHKLPIVVIQKCQSCACKIRITL